MVAKVGGDGLRGGDKQQDALRDPQGGKRTDVPEGLERKPKPPYDKDAGRNEKATQLPKDQ